MLDTAHARRTAVITPDEALTYADLTERADDVAAAFGGPARRLVQIHARNDLHSLLAYVGARRAGHAVMLGDQPGYDPDVVVAEGDVAVRRRHPAHPLHPDLALVLSTSGSTGSPKGVRLSHDNLDSNAAAISQYLGLTPDDRAVTSLPMHYCYGLSVINSHLAAGASLVLTDLSVVDQCFWTAFNRHQATNFAGVPYTFELLDRVGFDPRATPTLRFATQAGGRMDPERVRRYAARTRLFVMYGQTEATARMAYLPPEQAAAHPDCIGVPIPGGSFDIDDGELVYRGPNVMLGYAHGRADLALGRTVHELRTGDMAERTPDGLYRITGRRSRFVKLFGLRLDLDHVERAHGVVCAGDDAGLVVVGDPAVRHRLGLPPSAVTVVDDAPRLPTGKPDYAALLAMRAPSPTPAAPDVAALFGRLLGVDDVRGEDTFVSLGGDSLSYVEASVQLERLLGTLPPHWHTTPIALLQPSPKRATRMEANVVLRAAAIVLIVAGHADWIELEGGAHVLLAVAGFNFARFQLATGRMWRSILRVAVPSVGVIGAMAVFRDDFSWPHALLVNGLVGEPGSRWAYWYIEALVVILAGLALLLGSERVRRVERRNPELFAAAVLAISLAVRWLPDVSHRVARPHEVLWLFALGWAAALSRQRQRLVLTAVAAVAAQGFFHEFDRALVVTAGLVVLLWLPTVRVPRLLATPTAAVAAASLYVYLTHWAVYPWLAARTTPVLTTLGAVAVGVAAFRLEQACRRPVASLAGRVRRSGGGRAPAAPARGGRTLVAS